MIQDNHLTSYQTHRLIKQCIPNARTVYERENRGQMTFDEYIEQEEALECEQQHDVQTSFKFFLNGL